ncbi:MAG: cation diffusion facilitator family transporter [Nitrososphaerota archaeon]|nr:cation diffusion facilitator family transporter [Nitrososphaerota archaeon]
MNSDKLLKSGKVAKRFFAVQIAVGFAEVIAGLFTLSVALIADGVQSFADAGVSFIVWTGLRISRKNPDRKFPFGYHRFETMSSIIAAVFMGGLAAVLLYGSCQELLNPTPIINAEVSMIVASAALMASIFLLFYKRRAAKRYKSTALKTDAANSIKDVLTSATVLLGIALSFFLGITQTDAIAGIVIAFFVFTMIRPILRESSLVLLDAFDDHEIVRDIEQTAKQTRGVKQVQKVRMRKAGSYLIGDMRVVIDADLTVRDACCITKAVEKNVKQEFTDILDIKVIIEPDEPIQLPLKKPLEFQI